MVVNPSTIKTPIMVVTASVASVWNPCPLLYHQPATNATMGAAEG